MTNKELIKLVQNEENYQENYNLLVSSSRNRGLNKSKLDYYTEKHHIIPRCMGGKDEDDNYVLFTYPEHLIAHILLYKIYPNEKSLIIAANIMINPGCRIKADKNQLEESISLLNNIDFDTLEELRELNRTIRGRSLKCIDPKTGDILKIYKTLGETKDDGFSGNLHNLLIKNPNGVYYCGYLWKNSKDNDYVENPITPIPINHKTIVCHILDKVYYIIENVKQFSIESDFKLSKLRMAIKDGTKYGYYTWTRLEDFIKYYPNISLRNIISAKNNSLPIYKPHCVGCFDPISGNLLKVYDSVKDISQDGFSHQAIDAAITKKYRSFGYIWKRDLSLEQLLDYYSKETSISNINPKIITEKRRGLIQVNPKTKEIVKIITAEERDEFLASTKFTMGAIIQHISRGSTSPSKGFLWFWYEDYKERFPNKLKEYESRNQNSIETD